ncbi:DNA polymerase III subunit gamma/tau [Gottfriedia solisilvae]|uniref:DNA polymerase III subunit gamma/tau n=1 Tax=Gottfriedia solisilvae TaxID=1516104 RepID=UPI003D2EB2C2
MTYQALYRLWRPQQFKDVVGQNHIIRTLQNSLLQQKVSHAYLFTGPRGTGKTSTAKIFAKALNCENAPTNEPCNVCSVCKGITDGSISDVIEIDAASNNGVDEIRDIREKVKYAPSVGKYKVYIIDEVHMLSIGAFNALLKTLEEPPGHVIFILATTEPHKIPLTILSRCQRFDFHKISAQTISDRLMVVLNHQQTEIDPEALMMLSRAAEGGMRDALSILDQAISYSDQLITLNDVLSVTGTVAQESLISVVSSIKDGNVSACLTHIEELLNQGKDPVRFIEDLTVYFRDVLLYRHSPSTVELLERATVNDRFKEITEAYDDDLIYQIIASLSKSQQEMKWTNHPRVLLEVAIVQLCQKASVSNVGKKSEELTALLNKINHLEKEINHLKENGIAISTANNETASNTKSRSTTTRSKVPNSMIQSVLRAATKPEKNKVLAAWPTLQDQLRYQNKVSTATLVSYGEVVAASSEQCIVAFKSETICDLINNNGEQEHLTTINQTLSTLLGSEMSMLAIPEEDWKSTRDSYLNQTKQQETTNEVSPIVQEAINLVGEDLVIIKE